MRASVICFSERGGLLAERIREILMQRTPGDSGDSVRVYALPRYAREKMIPVDQGLGAWCRERWGQDEMIVFVGASGIAVRTIAPEIRSKTTDPAVLVADECGRFVISLLSGHLGGANEQAVFLAEALGAVPVITTATDVNGKFAVDVWAKKNRLHISSMKLAKEVSASVLSGQPVGYFCHSSVETAGRLPEELTEITAGDAADFKGVIMAVSPVRLSGFPQDRTLWLIPKNVYLGLGCRRGREETEITARTDGWLREAGIFPESIVCAASVDLKKDEEGVKEFCRRRGIPFVTYTAGELAAAEGEFSSSAFVSQITGTDNVCERAASLASGGGVRIMEKKAGGGVTAAAAAGKEKVEFWEN